MAKQHTKIYLVSVIVMAVLFACSSDNKSDENTQPEQKVEKKVERPKIVFFGNSLTAGYGLEQEQAYPTLIQNRLDSLGYNYLVVNAGNSGETSSGGLGRIDWVLKGNVAVFVLELGANDGLRGIPTEETYSNLKAILEKVKAKYPACKTILAGMKVPPNMGKEYSEAFETMFPKIAEETSSDLIPFFLENVAGIPELNQQDGIHPTAAGQKIVTNNVWSILKLNLKS